jgi:hypothetical protein
MTVFSHWDFMSSRLSYRVSVKVIHNLVVWTEVSSTALITIQTDYLFNVLHQQLNDHLQIQHKQKTNKYNQNNSKKIIIKIT